MSSSAGPAAELKYSWAAVTSTSTEDSYGRQYANPMNDFLPMLLTAQDSTGSWLVGPVEGREVVSICSARDMFCRLPEHNKPSANIYIMCMWMRIGETREEKRTGDSIIL